MKDKPEDKTALGKQDDQAKQANKHEIKRNRLQRQMSYGALLILAVVVVSFVAWPILSNGAARGENVSLGSYRGKPINYAPEYGLFNNSINYFLQQFGNSSMSNPLQRRSIFERAFFSTVSQYGHYFFLKDRGTNVSEKEINTIIYKQFESNGKLDRVAMSKLQGDPNRLKDTQNIMTYVAAQGIWDDVYDSLDLVENQAELELLVPTLGDVRKVSYLYYKLSEYPDSELEQYYEQHKDLFAKKFLRRIVVDSKEDRDKVESELKDNSTGSERFGELAQLYSSDVYSQDKGDWGNKYYYELRDFFRNSEVDDSQVAQWANDIYGLDEGAYVGPYEIGEQWFFFAIKSQSEIKAEAAALAQNDDEADNKAEGQASEAKVEQVEEPEETGFAPIASTVRTYVERNELALITDYFRRNLESLKSRAQQLEPEQSLAYLDQGKREVEANYSSTPEFFGFSYTGEESTSLYEPLVGSFVEDGLATAIAKSKDFFQGVFALNEGQLSDVLLLEAPETTYVAFFRLEDRRESTPADFAQGDTAQGLEGKKSLYNYYMKNLLTSGLELEFLAQKNLKSRFEGAYSAWNSRRSQ